MLKVFIFLTFYSTSLFASTDVKKVQDVLKLYFDGYQRADSKTIARAFHSDTKLLSVSNGKLDVTEMKDWIISVDARAARGDIRKGHMHILSLDITHETAIAKVHLIFDQFEFTDYLSLLKIDNKWKIAGKIYHFQEK